MQEYGFNLSMKNGVDPSQIIMIFILRGNGILKKAMHTVTCIRLNITFRYGSRVKRGESNILKANTCSLLQY